MSELNKDTDWRRVRRAMASYVASTSLRTLTGETGGGSPSGLQKFLDGATPKRKGADYLEWYLRKGQEWGGEDDVLEAAIEVILRHTKKDRRGWMQEVLEEETGNAVRAGGLAQWTVHADLPTGHRSIPLPDPQ